jgi:GTP-binding protein Era
VGKTNVGKSTLINRLVGHKVAITAKKPQTTRNRIVGIRTYGDRGQAVFLDTPGVHRPESKMGRIMVGISFSSLAEADLILMMIEATRDFSKTDEAVLNRVKRAGATSFLLINKVDVVRKEKVLPLIETGSRLNSFAEIIPISALTGEGVDLLEEKILDYLPEGPAYFPEDEITDQPQRAIMAEIIREKLLMFTRQELPYQTTVSVDMFKEEEGLIHIEATIYVERPSQKGIVIGKGGEMLKKIGTLAREEMELILDTRVYLGLWVKVKRGWREDIRFLKKLGINPL